MLIYKILNNNAVVSKNNQNKEIIIIGRGIAFKKSMYDEVDETAILKIYTLDDKKKLNKLERMVSEIPYEYFEIAEEIKKRAEKELNGVLNDRFSISLMDHICYSVEKTEKGIMTPNLMLSEIKRFYRKEFEVGLWAVEMINGMFGTKLNEDEAGFIAFHIAVNENDNRWLDLNKEMEMLQTIVDMIEVYFHMEIDKDSLEYARLITHLKFFISKTFKGKREKESSLQGDPLYEMLVEKYGDINVFLDRLNAVTLLNSDYSLSDTDRMYLIIHLARLMK